MGQQYDREQVLKKLEEIYSPDSYNHLFKSNTQGEADAQAIKLVRDYVQKDPDFHAQLVLSCFELSRFD